MAGLSVGALADSGEPFELDGALGPEQLIEQLREHPGPAAHRLLRRVQNLRVLDWDVWSWGDRCAEDVVADRPDMTVFDLAGFSEPEEAAVVALAVLDRLWAEREQLRPVLLVIDEAHNLCSPDAATPVRRRLVERIIQIAAEGRKYGLWLLLSTQRPSKIHPQVLSQCDNLCVMKLNAPMDLQHLSQYFGGVPAEALARIPGFSQGQAFFAGGFVPEPAVVQMGARLTREGGSDVRVPSTRQSLMNVGQPDERRSSHD